MGMSLLCVAVIAALSTLWCARGFYSAMLNLVCVLVGGAVAFGVWERLGYWLLEHGVGGDLLSGSAWAVAMAAPFIATVLALRAITNRLLGANVNVPATVDHIGGAVCGGAAGIITAGVIVLSLGMLRTSPDLLGHRAIGYGPGASLKRERGLVVPVDRIVSGVYGRMSTTTLSTATPLAVWHPRFEDEPALQRMSFGEGSSRNTLRPSECRLVSRYVVGGEGTPLRDLLGDTYAPGAQQVADLNGDPFPARSRLEGVVVTFGSGSKEKSGRVVIGPAQARLIARAEGGDAIPLHPIAVVSRTGDPARVGYARFRFDSRDLYVSSVGGEASTTMAFEFVVPIGYAPLALYVKGTRMDVPDAADTYRTVAARDEAIRRGVLPRLASEPVHGAGAAGSAPAGGADEWGVRVTDMLPDGVVIQDGTQGPDLEIIDGRIVSGMGRFDAKVVTAVRDVPPELRVRRFRAPDQATLVQVNVSSGARLSLLGRAIDESDRLLPVRLVSTDGQVFDAIGYYYQDEQKALVRFTVDRPVAGVAELEREGASLTKSRADQKLYLIFAVSTGVETKSFGLGSTVWQEFPRPIRTIE